MKAVPPGLRTRLISGVICRTGDDMKVRIGGGVGWSGVERSGVVMVCLCLVLWMNVSRESACPCEWLCFVTGCMGTYLWTYLRVVGTIETWQEPQRNRNNCPPMVEMDRPLGLVLRGGKVWSVDIRQQGWYRCSACENQCINVQGLMIDGWVLNLNSMWSYLCSHPKHHCWSFHEMTIRHLPWDHISILVEGYFRT